MQPQSNRFGKAIFAALAAAALAGCGARSDDRIAAVPITPMMGGQELALSDLDGATHIVMFWRSDCGPCLVELQHLSALREATGKHARLVLVALEDETSAQRALARFDAPLEMSYVVRSSPQRALEAVSGGGRRLPYAVALDRHGAICGRHVGLLGTNRVRQWARAC